MSTPDRAAGVTLIALCLAVEAICDRAVQA